MSFAWNYPKTDLPLTIYLNYNYVKLFHLIQNVQLAEFLLYYNENVLAFKHCCI